MKLEARDISFRYGEGERQVLAHVDLTVESGERVGIMAPSGFGKTTLLKILAGYERPESGEVLLDGTPLERFRGYGSGPDDLAAPGAFGKPGQTAENGAGGGGLAGGRRHHERAYRKGNGDPGGVEGTVSGGGIRRRSSQRFSIARALGQRTEILLADEITAMLDLITQRQIWSALLKETQSRGISLVAVSHSQELLEKICSRILHLSAISG